MMLTTHLLTGILIAIPVVILHPTLGLPVLTGAVLGSLIPDLDLYFGHRRTLHYPTLAIITSIPLLLLAAITVHPIIITAAVTVLAMGIHARMDLYGGGLELRPWNNNSDKAVYDHINGQWKTPKRLIRYDGSPEDVGLALILSIPPLLLFDGILWYIVITAVIISVLYGIMRKHIVNFGVRIIAQTPQPILSLLPERYLQETISDRG